jgi:toxin ParE1/3/4
LRRQIRLQRLAEQDLIAIWEYRSTEWGAAHADAYLEHLDQRIQSLVRNPLSGLPRDHVRKGYRVLLVKRHAMYYTISHNFIHVTRVLHGQMDPCTNL